MKFDLLRRKPVDEPKPDLRPVETPQPTTLQERMRRHFRMQAGPGSRCLLMDISDSMNSAAGIDQIKIKELRELAKGFPGERRFVFADGCMELKPTDSVPDASGSTNLAGALEHCKQQSICHVILITDGQPNNEQGALRAAQGLVVDIFYVGPEPMPDFLKRLGRLTGGGFNQATLNSAKQLQEKIQLLLPAPKK